MHGFANPTKFLKLAKTLLPFTTGVMLVCLAFGLYFAFVVSPADYQQGDTVRIMYIHVPSAMMSMGVFVLMGAAAFSGLVWKHPLAHLTAKAAAPVGAAFTFVTLVTGSLWGRPMWGTWWEWGDARMTSVLIQFFLYLGFMAIWRSIDDKERAAKTAAIVVLVGLVNIPIIKFSVEWWNTLHQGASIIRADGPSIDPSMRMPLLFMVLAAASYAATMIMIRLKAELAERRIDALQRAAAQDNA